MLAAALIDHNVHGLVQALRWDVATNCYEVTDGGLFERRFDELRRKRDRDDGSNGRPFSRMHKYYKLAMGERWAKTVKLQCCISTASLRMLPAWHTLLYFVPTQGARFSPKDPLLLRRLQSLSQSNGFSAEMSGPKLERQDEAPGGEMTMQALNASEVADHHFNGAVAYTGSIQQQADDMFVSSSYDSSDLASELSAHQSPNLKYDALSLRAIFFGVCHRNSSPLGKWPDLGARRRRACSPAAAARHQGRSQPGRDNIWGVPHSRVLSTPLFRGLSTPLLRGLSIEKVPKRICVRRLSNDVR